VVEAWAKKSFSVAGKFRESGRLKALEAKFFSKTKRRKAFSIISNYRQRCGWFVRSVAENNGLRGQLRIISIMLLAVALKRWESVGEEAGENVFFYSAGGILFQNASGGLSGFYLIG